MQCLTDVARKTDVVAAHKTDVGHTGHVAPSAGFQRDKQLLPICHCQGEKQLKCRQSLKFCHLKLWYRGRQLLLRTFSIGIAKMASKRKYFIVFRFLLPYLLKTFFCFVLYRSCLCHPFTNFIIHFLIFMRSDKSPDLVELSLS